jgi:hypothetical protein
MIRPPITPERMLGEASSAQIIYRSDIVHPRHQANFRIFDPLDFLAEVSAHIPDPHEKTTLLYGWYSNRTRGYRKRHGLLGKAQTADPVPDTDDRVPLEVRRSWARLIRGVYELDPLLCPRCGGTMRVIAVIEQPAVIRQILDHLGILRYVVSQVYLSEAAENQRQGASPSSLPPGSRRMDPKATPLI